MKLFPTKPQKGFPEIPLRWYWWGLCKCAWVRVCELAHGNKKQHCCGDCWGNGAYVTDFVNERVILTKCITCSGKGVIYLPRSNKHNDHPHTE